MIDIENLKQKLGEGVLNIIFTKKDGTERNIRCTLNGSCIPEEHWPKKTIVSKQENLLRVYDVENNGWRSFYASSIKGIIENG